MPQVLALRVVEDDGEEAATGRLAVVRSTMFDGCCNDPWMVRKIWLLRVLKIIRTVVSFNQPMVIL